MQIKKHIAVMVALLLYGTSAELSWAQKAGQSVSIQYGKVTAVQ